MSSYVPDAGSATAEIVDYQVQDTSVALSQEQTQPGDDRALTALRTGDSAAASLTPLTIAGQSESDKASSLDQPTIQQHAQAIHDALFKKAFFVVDDADERKILQVLESLTPAQRRDLEETFNNQYEVPYGGPLRMHLQQRLGEVDFRRAEAILNRRDNETNHAGAVMVALTTIGIDPVRGNEELRVALKTLTHESVEAMRSGFQADYGLSFEQSVSQVARLSPENQQALDYFLKGNDRRDAGDLVAMAKIAVSYENADLLAIALSGDSDAVVEARSKLAQDAQFMESFKRLWGDDQVMLDYMGEGRISLATIATENSDNIWFLNNKDNIKQACLNVSADEKARFALGRQLASTHSQPASDDERTALNFYTRIRSTFDVSGTALETLAWEDQILRGGSIVSDLISSHSEGGVFGLGAGTDKQALLTAVENMSEPDWKALKNPSSDSTLRRDLETALGMFCTTSEREQVLQLIDDKTKASTFAESQIPKVSDLKVDAVLQNQTNGASSEQSLRDIEALLQDPSMRAMMQKERNELSAPEKTLRSAIEAQTSVGLNPVASRLSSSSYYGELIAAYAEENPNRYDPYRDPGVMAIDAVTDRFFKDGHLPAIVKVDLGFERTQLYRDLSSPQLPAAERETALSLLSDAERRIVDNAISQGGKLSLADELRAFTLNGGKYASFRERLTDLSAERVDALKQEYSTKYQSLLVSDFLAHVAPNDSIAYKAFFTAEKVDPTQQYLDFEQLRFDNSGGLSVDGSSLTLARAADLYADALQKFGGNIPEEQRRVLAEHFSESVEQYADSKEKLAEIVVDSAITVAAISATIASGGTLSPVALAAVAGGSAVVRVAGMKAIEGGSFDDSVANILKEGGLGALTGVLNGLGPETYALLGKIGTQAEAKALLLLKGTALEGSSAAEKQLASSIGRVLADRAINGRQITAAQVDELAARMLDKATLEAAARGDAAALTQLSDASATLAKELGDAVVSGTTGSTAANLQVFARNTLRSSTNNAVFGAGANMATEPVYAALNGEELDADRLLRSGLTGGTAGFVAPAVLNAVVRGAEYGASRWTNAVNEGRPHGVDVGQPRVDAPTSSGDAADDISALRTLATENEALRQNLTSEIYTDEKTGLLNKAGFRARVNESIALAQRAQGTEQDVALNSIYIDVDGFRDLNNTYGHDKGDEALAFLGYVIRKQLRESDYVCRDGGDEFAALIMNGEDLNAAAARLGAVRVGLMPSGIFREIPPGESPHPGEHLLTMSVGVSEWKPGMTADKLIAAADERMRHNKLLRKSGVVPDLTLVSTDSSAADVAGDAPADAAAPAKPGDKPTVAGLPINRRLGPDFQYSLQGMSATELRQLIANQQNDIAQLSARTGRDQLTGFLKPSSFRQRVTQALTLAQREDNPVVQCAFLDVDGFKTVDDQLGHVAGDRAMKAVSELIREQSRKTDVLGREGGDEYIVLLRGTADPDSFITKFRNMRIAVGSEGDIRVLEGTEGLGMPAGDRLPTGEYVIGISAGYATWERGWDADQLIKAADEQMYINKQQRERDGLRRPRVAKSNPQ